MKNSSSSRTHFPISRDFGLCSVFLSSALGFDDDLLTRRALGPSGPVKVAKKEADQKPVAKPAVKTAAKPAAKAAAKPTAKATAKPVAKVSDASRHVVLVALAHNVLRRLRLRPPRKRSLLRRLVRSAVPSPGLRRPPRPTRARLARLPQWYVLSHPARWYSQSLTIFPRPPPLLSSPRSSARPSLDVSPRPPRRHRRRRPPRSVLLRNRGNALFFFPQ